MPRRTYLREASGMNPLKGSAGRLGYEVLDEKKPRDPYDFGPDRSRGLTDTEWEPTHHDYGNEEC